MNIKNLKKKHKSKSKNLLRSYGPFNRIFYKKIVFLNVKKKASNNNKRLIIIIIIIII